MTADQVVEMIRAAGAKSQRDILDVLEDGEALLALGITDADREAVEGAHALVRSAVRGMEGKQ